MKPRLSVIIVAKNEAQNIADCVRSASFADEVIVLDSGSTDGTAELARALGARVEVTDWPGYGPQNNRGIDLATGDWFFSLDADERIERPDLRPDGSERDGMLRRRGRRLRRLHRRGRQHLQQAAHLASGWAGQAATAGARGQEHRRHLPGPSVHALHLQRRQQRHVG